MELIKAENLIFSYPLSGENALDGVNFSVNRGELALIMGRTGSGKSTLLKLMIKELAPVGELGGTLEVNFDAAAYVPQNAENTFVSETVRGELAFALENKQITQSEISVKIGEISSFFNITDLLDKKTSEISGGEKSIVAIAAAMASGADTLILDEPLAQLDPRAVQQVLSVIRRVNDELGTTVVIASHISEGIISICDSVAVLENGKVIAQGSARELAKREELLPFYPVCTSLFEERPLTVKEARACEKRFAEKPLESAPESEAAVKIKNLMFAYKKGERDIIDMLSLTVGTGEIHAVVGANGCGKTTLLKLIAGIKKPYSGKVKVSGECAYIPQNVRYLFTKDTVGEEISEESAKAFSLEKYLNRHPYDLSGGEQQLLALAKVSAQGFDVLLLDEPAKSLDSFGKALVSEYIRKLKADGKTVIIVSHDLDFAADIADKVSFMSDGRIALSDSPRLVFSKLSLYTTQVRRITAEYLETAVSAEDFV